MKASVLSLLLALCLLAGAGALLAAQEPTPAVESSVGPNLLSNPSFEGEYHAYDPTPEIPDCPWGVCDTAKTAAGWTPYWRSHNIGDLPWIINMPEFEEEGRQHTDPERVRDGEKSQSYFKLNSTFEAGIYQQVSVTPGQTYCFSAWGHSWSAQDSPGPDGDAYTGPEDGRFRQRVGIDPTGGTNWQSANIVWGNLRIQPDFYAPFYVTATAQAESVTAYVYGQPEWAVKHNDAYWDDAYLGEVAPVLPDGELALTVPADKPAAITKTVNPNWLCDAETSWEVTLEPAGAFTPTLSTTAGATGESLTVTLDSNGLPPGIYETALQFSSPDTEVALPAIPVRLAVVVLDNHLYLPNLSGGGLAP